jgi:hypothetical protein
MQQQGFLRGFVLGILVMVAVWGVQAVAKGPQIQQSPQILPSRETVAWETMATELRYMRQNGIKIAGPVTLTAEAALPVEIKKQVSVEVVNDVTVKTGASDFKVKSSE